MEHKLIVAEPADPRRCQGPGDAGQGQCRWLSVEGSDRCAKHGANKQIQSAEKKQFHDYLIQKWQVRLDQFAASERVTNLHGELAILRMQIETISNMCENQQDLVLYSQRISDLVMKADKLVNSIDKINNRSGNLLDKGAALSLAGKIVDIIVQEIPDQDAVERVSKGILNLVTTLAGVKTSE